MNEMLEAFSPRLVNKTLGDQSNAFCHIEVEGDKTLKVLHEKHPQSQKEDIEPVLMGEFLTV